RSASREDPTRVNDPEGIERALDRAHDVDHIRTDLVDQRLATRQADAMLGRHGSAEREGGVEDLVADGLRELGRPGVVVVDDEIRVEVAVARMAERRDGDAVATRGRLDRDEQVRDATDRHPYVLHPD